MRLLIIFLGNAVEAVSVIANGSIEQGRKSITKTENATKSVSRGRLTVEAIAKLPMEAATANVTVEKIGRIEKEGTETNELKYLSPHFLTQILLFLKWSWRH